jgi:hypothetical protein
MRKPPAAGGFALAEALLIVSLIGLAGVASIALVRTSALRSQRARLDGAQASVAFRVLDQLDAALVKPDTGLVKVVAGGREFEVHLVTRDSILAGAIEIRVAGQGGGSDLVLEAPRPDG